MVDVSEVAKNIYMIDNQLFSIPRWGSVYLINEANKNTLIETGPTTSVTAVLEGISELGVRPEDIAYIILTHSVSAVVKCGIISQRVGPLMRGRRVLKSD